MKNPVPSWMREALGLESAGAGEGTVWSLRHAWPLAPGATLVAVSLIVALVVWAYSRERGDAAGWGRSLLAGLRISALAIALFMLAEVVLSFERTGLPPLVVMVDDSASMSLEDRESDQALASELLARSQAQGLEGRSRFNQARLVLLEHDARVLRRLERDYRLKLFLVADTARPETGGAAKLVPVLSQAQPTGEATRLGESLRTVLNDLRGTPPSAVVLLSDGVTTAGESLSQGALLAQRKGVPLFTIGLGSETPLRDLKLSDLLVDEVVFVDDIVSFQCKLTASGYPGEKITVVLRSLSTSEELARTQVTAGATDQPIPLRLTYRPHEVGDFEFVVEALSREDELDTENNRQTALVSVRGEKVRVLLAQAYPNYEFRFLKNLLERDQTVELQTVLQEADPEYVESDRTALRVFPSRRDALYEFDVVILGDVNPAFFSAATLDNLTAFVEEKGGGLILIAGPRYMPLGFAGTPLAELLPLDLASGGTPPVAGNHDEAFLVQPTELGLLTPPLELGNDGPQTAAIWQQLAPLYWSWDVPRLKPGAMVLAEHPRRLGPDGRPLPLVTLSYVGPGKVVFHATDETWRWRMRVGDVYFARYWVQTIRYLSRLKLLGKDQGAELTVDRREYRQGDPIRLRVRFADPRKAPPAEDSVQVVLESAGRAEQRVALARNEVYRGIFEGELVAPTTGKFHAWLATPSLGGRPATTDFSVVAPPGEMHRTQLDVAEISRAAEMTGGRFYRFDQAARLLDDLPAGRQVPIEALPPIVLWNRWPLLLAFVLLLAAEWSLRKWRGML